MKVRVLFKSPRTNHHRRPQNQATVARARARVLVADVTLECVGLPHHRHAGFSSTICCLFSVNRHQPRQPPSAPEMRGQVLDGCFITRGSCSPRRCATMLPPCRHHDATALPLHWLFVCSLSLRMQPAARRWWLMVGAVPTHECWVSFLLPTINHHRDAALLPPPPTAASGCYEHDRSCYCWWINQTNRLDCW